MATPEWLAKMINAGQVTSHGVNYKALEEAMEDGKGVNIREAAAAATWAGFDEAAAAAMTEAQWQELVEAFARSQGWMTYHTRDSRGSDPGFFDLVMVKECINTGGVWVYVAELKTMDGKQTKEQKEWERLLAVLMNSNKNWAGETRFRVYLWRPDKWEMVKKILSQPME